MNEGVSIQVRRSYLGRVRGMGSAKDGVHHWYVERLTALALVPLTLWFIFSMIRLAGASQEAVVSWAGRPWNSVLLLATVAMTFQHMQLGLQMVIEDYVHDRLAQRAAILAVKAVCLLAALFAVLAVLKLALW